VIATQILLTADISEDCMADPDCIQLAALHSTAVDFPKTGRHVSFNQLPRPKNKRKPDWYANETNENKSGFYPSNRHIGHLFRDIYLPAIPEAKKVAKRQHRQFEAGTEDVELGAVMNAYSRNDGLISRRLKRKIDECVDVNYHARSGNLPEEINEMLDIFEDYGRELAYSCSSHSLSRWTALTEEEIVAGTIVAKCPQPVRVMYPLSIYSDKKSTENAFRHDIRHETRLL
jgi:RNA-dependent RNA polymerase